MVCLSRPYPLKFFKGCLPQNLLNSLLNTFSHISLPGKTILLGSFLNTLAHMYGYNLHYGQYLLTHLPNRKNVLINRNDLSKNERSG